MRFGPCRPVLPNFFDFDERCIETCNRKSAAGQNPPAPCLARASSTCSIKLDATGKVSTSTTSRLWFFSALRLGVVFESLPLLAVDTSGPN